MAAGSAIQRSSLRMTAAPSALKKEPTPIGDTWIGRQAKKYRVVSKGEKKATPRPSLVMASSTPCDMPAQKKKDHRPMRGAFHSLRGNMRKVNAVAMIAANKIE